MQVEEIETADATSVATLADLPADASSGPRMLGLCTAPGCATVVFGRGTCVAHDPGRLLLATALFGEATERGASSSHH